MTYQYRPAEPGDAPMMLGVAGPSRSGKTYSALRIALGMTGDISKVFVLDTERSRARQYVGRFGKFMHCNLEEPFTSEKYAEAVGDAEKAGAVVIIVDSMSHEHEGAGGILEQHETELTRMAGATDWAKRDRMNFSAWIKPKRAHNQFVNKMLQVNTHMIFAFRAKDKLAMVKNREGKMLPTAVGWQPICADRFEYEMTGMLILPPGSKGTPDLDANAAGLREPLDTMFKQGDQLTEATGERLMQWANSGRSEGFQSSTGNDADPLAEARKAAAQGTAAFRDWWNGAGKTKTTRDAAKPHMAELQATAAEADSGGQEDEDPFGLTAPGETETDNHQEATGDGGNNVVVDGHVILLNGDSAEIGRFKLPDHYFDAVQALLPKAANPRAFLKLNQAGAEHFIGQDKDCMATWVGLWAAANEAEAAQASTETPHDD